MKFLIPLFILLFISIVSSAQKCPSGEERIASINRDLEEQILILTNVEREKEGLKPLKWNDKLAYAARYHAKDMAVDDYFDHYSYDRNNKGELVQVCTTFDRMGAFIDFPLSAENISAGRSTAKSVVKSWMQSSGHRKNILREGATELGVGFYIQQGSEYVYYWVQNFGGGDPQ